MPASSSPPVRLGRCRIGSVLRLARRNHVLYDIKHVYPQEATDGRL